MKNTIKEIIVHHTGGTEENPLFDTSNQSFEVVNEYHRNSPRTWLGYYSAFGYAIGYHYYIDKQGKVTQGRSDTEIGAHTVGHNDCSIGICLAGNFDVTLPTQEQIEALKGLLNTLRAKYNIELENIVPHRHFANKSCYGRLLSDDWITKLLTPVHVSVKPCAAEADIIKLQEVKISNLQKFISSLINILTKSR